VIYDMIDDLDDERCLQLEECAQMDIEDNDSKYIVCHEKMNEIRRESLECAHMYREDSDSEYVRYYETYNHCK
jgi:hypothetical protein